VQKNGGKEMEWRSAFSDAAAAGKQRTALM